MNGASLIAGLKYGMVGWKLEWNDGCTELQLTWHCSMQVELLTIFLGFLARCRGCIRNPTVAGIFPCLVYTMMSQSENGASQKLVLYLLHC